MHQISKAPLLLFSAALLMASGPVATDKSVPQWTDADARKILNGSAWVKVAKVSLLPQRGVSAMREGGRMGGTHGVGLAALRTSSLFGGSSPATSSADSTTTTRKRLRKKIPDALEVRWESAAPVRVAELAAKEDDPPTWQGEMYAVAVYDVPGLDVDDSGLRAELQHGTFLMLDGKKEVRAAHVDLLPQEGDLTTVVYLFPRTAKITLATTRIEFTTRFGRLALSQYFYPKEMQFHGKLEL